MRNYFAVAILCCIGTYSYSQITLRGQVLDSATQEPLSLPVIKIANFGSVADDEGYFRIDELPKGTHVLKVSHVGCDTKLVPILLQKDTTITIYLPHHDHSFEEVIHYGHQGNSEPSARLTHLISTQKLEHLAATSLGDALQNVNGVGFLKTGTTIAKPIINGMHSNRISVINDDSKQEGQQWGSEHSPEIDPLSSGSIELIKGASTLRYGGDAMGGVIRILPATFDDSTYTRLSLLAKGESNTQGGQIGLKIENHNNSLGLDQRFVVNAKRHGDGRTPKYTLSNTAFAQLSGSHLAHFKTKRSELSLNTTAFVQQLGILAAAHIGNVTDLNRALVSDTPLVTRPFTYTISTPSQRIQHYATKLKWQYEHDILGSLIASYTLQINNREEFDNHRGGTDAALDLNLTTQQLNILIDRHVDQLRWQYGLMGEQQENIFGGRYFIPNYRRYKGGAFGIATLEEDHYLIEAGVRYDIQNTNTYRYVDGVIKNDQFDYRDISANISGWRSLSEDLKVHLSVATRFRSPDINELFSDGLHHGSAALEFGDLSLEQERSYDINGGINYNHNRLRLQVEPYFHYFQNYIYLQPSGETQLSIRGAFPVFRYVQTDATYAGVDIDARYRLTAQCIAEAQVSLLYVNDVKHNEFIYGIPAQRLSGKLKYNFAHILGFKNGYWWIRPSYTAQQNRVEPQQDFTETPNAYILLDTEMGAQYKDTPLHISLGVNNILNTSYRDYMNRYRYFADDLGINFHITFNYTF